MRKIIDRQLNGLIKEAARYQVSPLVMEKAIVPILKLFIKDLKHSEYFILQNQQGNILLTTIRNNLSNPPIEKKVVYAFASLTDALSSTNELSSETTPDLNPSSLPVTEILFRLFSTQEIDSIIFMDIAGDSIRGKEVDRLNLQNSIERQIQEKFSRPPSNLA
jgi:hypothetical protein